MTGHHPSFIIKDNSWKVNSKQLMFFIMPEDLSAIYSFFNIHNIKYIRENVISPHQVQLQKLPPHEGKPWEKLYITYDEFSQNLFFNKNKKSSDYVIDIDKSYVLEFSPGGFYPYSSKTLHRARFYCPTQYFVSNGETVAKSNAFKSWVDKIYKSFKKEFLIKLGDENKIFFSPKTVAWMKQNGGKIDNTFLKIEI